MIEELKKPIYNSFGRKIQIVAELKPYSPFGYVSNVWLNKQFDIAESIGDIISVHTGADWGGSLDWLKEIRRRTQKLILAKGFHPSIMEVNRAFDCGADFVLTVGWWPRNNHRCWHEPETLIGALTQDASYTVCNSRCPRTGETRHKSYTDKMFEKFGNLWICQASGIKKIEDIHPKASAVLIGEGLYD